MRKTLREPALVLTLMIVVGLLGFFIIYPQLRVVLVPGLAGYVEFVREQTWVKPLLHSLQITVLSTTTAVTLGFVYAYAMVYSDMPWKRFFRLVGIGNSAVGEEQGRRVRYLGETAVAHLEHADLVGRPEAVLDRAQDAELVAALALEVEHRVDHVLEHTWPGNLAVLGDMADELSLIHI